MTGKHIPTISKYDEEMDYLDGIDEQFSEKFGCPSHYVPTILSKLYRYRELVRMLRDRFVYRRDGSEFIGEQIHGAGCTGWGAARLIEYRLVQRPEGPMPHLRLELTELGRSVLQHEKERRSKNAV